MLPEMGDSRWRKWEKAVFYLGYKLPVISPGDAMYSMMTKVDNTVLYV